MKINWFYGPTPMGIWLAHDNGDKIQMRKTGSKSWRKFNGLISIEGDYEYRVEQAEGREE